MFYIIYNILNSIDTILEKSNSKYINSTLDNFIDNLKFQLNELKNIEKLDKLPKNTQFIVDRFEGNFAVCEEITTQNMFNIPKFELENNIKSGDVIHLENNLYVLNKELTKLNYENSKKMLDGLYKK